MSKNCIETIRFITTDGLWLGGLLYIPNSGASNTVVISIHGAQSAVIRERETLFGNVVSKSGISFFSFNNRSTAILERFNKSAENNSVKRVLYGSANDNLKEGIYDIESAIELMKDYGYENIILLGHCLGCIKILDYLKHKTSIVKAVCFISPSDVINYQKDRLGNRYDQILNYASNNIEKLELMNDWVLEITPKTYYDYFNSNSITQSTNYKINYIKYWRDMTKNLFVSFAGINEVITVDPIKVLSEIKKSFPDYNIETKYYEKASHSYVKEGSIVINDIVKFIKECDFYE